MIRTQFDRTWMPGLRFLAVCALTLAAGSLAFAVPAGEQPRRTPPEDAPKAKPREPGNAPEIEAFKRLLENLPAGVDGDAIRQQIERAMKDLEQARKQMEQLRRFRPDGFPPSLLSGRLGKRGDGRLGVVIDKPTEALADQLDLPKGQGLVIGQVQPDSAAAKAGLKPNDILLELNGKPVPDDASKFVQQLDEIKANTPVDAMVLRKGKKEIVKGVTLPERKPSPPGFSNVAVPMIPNIQFPNVPFGAGNQVMTTTFRMNDRFTTRYQEGTLVITVTGSVADGKAKVGEIQVQDGGRTDKYDSLDKVPPSYRDKARNLIEMSEKSSIKIEIKQP